MFLLLYIYQPLYHFSGHNKLLTFMYVLCISLINRCTYSQRLTSQYRMMQMAHKEKFEPASMEHNYFQLMQYIQFQIIFECTLIYLLCMFLHPMVVILCPCSKVTWVPELSIYLIQVAAELNHLWY